jgi:hypothetical protein
MAYMSLEEVRAEVTRLENLVRCVRTDMELNCSPPPQRLSRCVADHRETQRTLRGKYLRLRARLENCEELIEVISLRVLELSKHISIAEDHEKQIQRMEAIANQINLADEPEVAQKLDDLTKIRKTGQDMRWMKRALIIEAEALYEMARDPTHALAECDRLIGLMVRHERFFKQFLLQVFDGDRILDETFERLTMFRGLAMNMRESGSLQRLGRVEREMEELLRDVTPEDMVLVEEMRNHADVPTVS